MSRAVTNEIREKIIRHKRNGSKEDDIAKWLLISKSTVTKIWARYRRTGNYQPSPRTQGRKPCVDEATMARIEEKIKEVPDMTLAELIDEFELTITQSALCRRLKKLDYSFKKNSHTRQSKTSRRFRKNGNSSGKL